MTPPWGRTARLFVPIVGGGASRDVYLQDRRLKLVTTMPHTQTSVARNTSPGAPPPPTGRERALHAQNPGRRRRFATRTLKHMAAAPGSMADGGRNLTSTTPAPAIF